MKIYNTLTNQKEEFIPLEKNKVKMYVCGPTVYNFIHIGNARPFVIFDVVRRYFEEVGYEVDFVQNFTDVDDKIINKANQENSTMEEIGNRYIKEFFTDVDGLGVKRATNYPRVTEEISGIIEMIETLIEKGFAYNKGGTVYFRTEKFDSYGKLSNRKLEDMEMGLRIAVSEEKESPWDFVLWKVAKENEPFWNSPWGDGRPGWHIECSVMSKKYLGEQIDIHAGGEDLIFPHHENEIAQSEAASGKQFANYWLHNSMLTVDNKKMSKSDGNFFMVRDIVKKYSYDVMRFYILNGHYRMPLNFSDELLNASKSSLERIKNSYFETVKAKEVLENSQTEEDKNKVENLKLLKAYENQFMESMADDFNTTNAITSIFELVKFANVTIKENKDIETIGKIVETFEKLCGILGISLEVEKKENFDDGFILEAIEERKKAKAEKDFKRADEIRDELLAKGIAIKDGRDGVSWSFV